MKISQKKAKYTENEQQSESEHGTNMTEKLLPQENLHLQKPPLTPIERVKIMNDFASAAMDESLKKQILERPNGQEIYDVFVMAMNNKISAIMDNDPARYQILSEVTEKAISANEMIGEVNSNLAALSNFLKVLSGSMAPKHQGAANPPPSVPTHGQQDIRTRAEEVRRAQQQYLQTNSPESRKADNDFLIKGI